MEQNTGILKSPYLRGGSLKKQKEKYLMLFIVSFLGMMVSFIPSLIINKGVFLYYGDFNSQQMMFYNHAQDMVKSGNFGWDWGTDLGTGFVTSYSFYLLGSPFFWITALFPDGTACYLIPWLLALKTAVASVTAYAYIRRFVKNKDACFVGGMLYAFSGFQAYNVFFNHFHDATALFPLLLLGLELLVNENKKGAFLLAVAVNAITNYFFFIGDCVFLLIYFFIRCTDKDFKLTIKKLGVIVFESVVGVMIACIILLPSCLAILNNYRVNEKLTGLDMIIYYDNTRIFRIFQAFFMMSDMPARINISGSDKARWASLAGYLPLFSMCGVIAYMKTRKKDWASKLIWVCTIFACIPILNSAFVMFNSSYYARWYYSPILIMCLMTASVIGRDPRDLKKGFAPVCILGLAFLGVGLLPKKENDSLVYLKIPKYIELYYLQAGVTLLMIIMLAVLLFVYLKKKELFKTAMVCMTAVACIICMTSTVLYGVAQGEDNPNYIEKAINGGENIDMQKLEKHSEVYDPNNSFYRIDTSPNVDNWCMFWKMSSMRCFHSVVSTSIMDFYTSVGQSRDVASRIETSEYPLRSLLSAKYYFSKSDTDESAKNADMTFDGKVYHNELQGFKLVDTQNGFNIYENENYIPMGFAFDKYVLESEIKDQIKLKKSQTLLKAVTLTKDQAIKYADYVQKADLQNESFTYAQTQQDCNERRANCCYSFKYDTNGFEGRIKLDKKQLVFFSVPYDEGWSAQVNGKSTDIIKVDYGFMAVACDAGDSTITFNYKTYGMTAGKALTAGGIVIFAVYMGVVFYCKKKERFVPDIEDGNENNEKNDETSVNVTKIIKESDDKDVSE